MTLTLIADLDRAPSTTDCVSTLPAVGSMNCGQQRRGAASRSSVEQVGDETHREQFCADCRWQLLHLERRTSARSFTACQASHSDSPRRRARSRRRAKGMAKAGPWMPNVPRTVCRTRSRGAAPPKGDDAGRRSRVIERENQIDRVRSGVSTKTGSETRSKMSRAGIDGAWVSRCGDGTVPCRGEAAIAQLPRRTINSRVPDAASVKTSLPPEAGSGGAAWADPAHRATRATRCAGSRKAAASGALRPNYSPRGASDMQRHPSSDRLNGTSCITCCVNDRQRCFLTFTSGNLEDQFVHLQHLRRELLLGRRVLDSRVMARRMMSATVPCSRTR